MENEKRNQVSDRSKSAFFETAKEIKRANDDEDEKDIEAAINEALASKQNQNQDDES